MMKPWCAFPVLLALVSGCGPDGGGEPPVREQDADAPVSALERRSWEPCTSTPRRLADLRSGPEGSEPRSLVHGDRVLFFVADDGLHGAELWKSSGTGGAGTSLVKDLRPGPEGSLPSDLTLVGSRLFFIADDGVHGRALWTSDGTTAGTRLVEDISPVGSSFAAGQVLVAFEGRLYFSADDGVHGTELWTSDGTGAGTFMVGDLVPGPDSSFPRRFIVHDGALYFVISVEDENWLVRSDGGSSFTPVFMVFEDTVIFRMKSVGRKLFFLVDFDEGEANLFVTDGTAAGTRFLRFFPGGYPHDMVVLHGRLYFSAGSDTAAGEELWVSDGTPSGTRMVKDIRPGDVGSDPAFLAVVGGRIFFAADDGTYGRELWVSDGTSRGTRLFKDLEPGAGDSFPSELAGIQDWLFFSATTAGHGAEPWVSDGTVAGTRQLRDVAPGAASSFPRGFIRSGWDVFFTADDGTHGRELYALPFRPEGECGGARRLSGAGEEGR